MIGSRSSHFAAAARVTGHGFSRKNFPASRLGDTMATQCYVRWRASGVSYYEVRYCRQS